MVGSLAALASGRLHLVAVWHNEGDVVTSITFYAGNTAAASPSNQRFGLYSAALAKLAVTNDDTSTAWGANTAKTLALTEPYAIPLSG